MSFPKIDRPRGQVELAAARWRPIMSPRERRGISAPNAPRLTSRPTRIKMSPIATSMISLVGRRVCGPSSTANGTNAGDRRQSLPPPPCDHSESDDANRKSASG